MVNLEISAPEHPSVAEELPGVLSFLVSLCHVQAARAAGEVSRICADLVFGYNAHPEWTEEACDACEGSKPAKAGPCPEAAELQPFLLLSRKLSVCLTGSRLAKDRAATALSQVMIPEALDYPQ